MDSQLVLMLHHQLKGQHGKFIVRLHLLSICRQLCILEKTTTAKRMRRASPPQVWKIRVLLGLLRRENGNKIIVERHLCICCIPAALYYVKWFRVLKWLPKLAPKLTAPPLTKYKSAYAFHRCLPCASCHKTMHQVMYPSAMMDCVTMPVHL